jgi:hypothetical protein
MIFFWTMLVATHAALLWFTRPLTAETLGLLVALCPTTLIVLAPAAEWLNANKHWGYPLLWIALLFWAYATWPLAGYVLATLIMFWQATLVLAIVGMWALASRAEKRKEDLRLAVERDRELANRRALEQARREAEKFRQIQRQREIRVATIDDVRRQRRLRLQDREARAAAAIDRAAARRWRVAHEENMY